MEYLEVIVTRATMASGVPVRPSEKPQRLYKRDAEALIRMGKARPYVPPKAPNIEVEKPVPEATTEAPAADNREADIKVVKRKYRRRSKA